MPTSPNRSRIGIRIGVAVAVVAAAAALTLYLIRPTAQVVRVTRGHADDARPGSVTVEAGYEEDIKTEVSGRIIKSALEEGEHFREGDFMAQLDTGDLELDLEKAQNDLDALRRIHAVGSATTLQLETARADLANSKRMFDLGGLSQMDFDAKNRAVKQIEQALALEEVTFQNTVAADELAIKAKRREIDKMTIRAPFDGVVSVVDARPGQIIALQTPIATLISSGRTVEARISEEKFAGIAVGQKASVEFLGYEGKVFDAKVSKVLPTAEAATQRYVVYLDVDIPVDKLVPGLTGETVIDVDTHPMALLAPRRALIGGNRLLVVRDGRIEERTIKLGYTSLTLVEVLSGVEEGDLVVSEDLDRFSPGDRVRTELLPN
jgi:RND family efflux transporter MFP subunit